MASLSLATALAKQSLARGVGGVNFPCETTSRIVTANLSVRRSSSSIVHENLSWTSSRSLGKTRAVFVPKTSRSSQGGSRIIAFTQEQAKIVKESWKLVQKDDSGKWALAFFLKVFEIAPSVKRMFSFLQDPKYPQIEKNPKLKGHALQVFMMTGQAAIQLGEKGGLGDMIPKLIQLGDKHVGYGVVDEHFDVVGFALLTTLGEALGEKWTPEAKEAWATAYDEIVSNIKSEMELVRSRQQQKAVMAQ